MNRRQFLKLSAAMAAGLIAPVSLGRSGLRFARAEAEPPQSPNLSLFTEALPIPGVVQPMPKKLKGATYYEISMMEITQKVHADLPETTFWGYGVPDSDTPPSFPGPTIETRKNEKVSVNWKNRLYDIDGVIDYTINHYLGVDTALHGPDHHGAGARTVVHLHGGNVPPEIDGYPEDTILPGGNALYEGYSNRQFSNTLWYHDHALGITRLNVYMGLAGFWLLRDGFEDRLGLPSGEYEIPIVIQDRTIYGHEQYGELFGQLWYPYPWQEEYFADIIVVNGKAWPYLEVKPRKYRFRFLNGSNGRAYWLWLQNESDGSLPAVHQIGADGGLLPASILTDMTHGTNASFPSTGILIAPAERADVIMDFTGFAPGTKITLKNKADAPLFLNDGIVDQPDIMQFRIVEGGNKPDKSVVPVTLRSYDPMDPAWAVKTRDFVFQVIEEVPDTDIRLEIISLDPAWQNDPDPAENWEQYIVGHWWDDIVGGNDINGVPDPNGPAVMGTYEIWRFWNPTPDMHPLHMHLINFQLLDRVGSLVPDPEREEFFRLELGEGAGPLPMAPNEAALKDTVKMFSGQVTSIIMKWGTYPGLFPFHCHILDHEDHEMMRQVLVVQEPEL